YRFVARVNTATSSRPATSKVSMSMVTSTGSRSANSTRRVNGAGSSVGIDGLRYQVGQLAQVVVEDLRGVSFDAVSEERLGGDVAFRPAEVDGPGVGDGLTAGGDPGVPLAGLGFDRPGEPPGPAGGAGAGGVCDDGGRLLVDSCQLFGQLGAEPTQSTPDLVEALDPDPTVGGHAMSGAGSLAGRVDGGAVELAGRREVDLAVCVADQAERAEHQLAGVEASVSFGVGFADLHRRRHRRRRRERRLQFGDRRGGGVAVEAEGGHQLAAEDLLAPVPEDGLGVEVLVLVEAVDVADRRQVLHVDGDGPQVAGDELVAECHGLVSSFGSGGGYRKVTRFTDTTVLASSFPSAWGPVAPRQIPPTPRVARCTRKLFFLSSANHCFD